MLKKTVTYRDFDDNERNETLYFNMNQVELTEFAMDLPDDVTKIFADNPGKVTEEEALQIVNTLGGKGILSFIKKLVLKSYGIKAADGRRFMKEDENGRPLSVEFSQTLAFEAIVMDLMSNEKEAAAFVNAIIPAKLADKVNDANNIQALPSK